MHIDYDYEVDGGYDDGYESEDFSGALDFSGEPAPEHGAELIDMPVAGELGEEPAEDELDDLGDYTPADSVDDTDTGIGTLAEDPDADIPDTDPEAAFNATVTNPPETVSVTASVDGRIQQVELLPKGSGLTETELAGEILVLAGLARQRALAGQQTFLRDNAPEPPEILRDSGVDFAEAMRDIVTNAMRLPTTEQADAAQAEVFATRYGHRDD